MELLDTIFTTGAFKALGWTLVHSLWQAGAIALVTGVILLLMKKSSPVARYRLAYGALVLMFMVSLFTYGIYFGRHQTGNLPHQPVWQDISLKETMSSSAIEMTRSDTSLIKEIYLQLERSMPFIVILWLLGSGIFILRQLGGYIYVQRLRYHNLWWAGQGVQGCVDRISGHLGVKKAIQVFESASVHIPVTIGFLKPVILIPLGLLGSLPVDQVEAILVHELAHIRRKDYLFNIIQSIIESLLFFNPAVWWVSSIIRMEREHICDDISIEYTNDSLTYIKALTNMEHKGFKAPRMAAALSGRKNKLLARVKRIIHPGDLSHPLPQATVFSTALLAGLLLVMTSAAVSLDNRTADRLASQFGQKQDQVLAQATTIQVENTLNTEVGDPAPVRKYMNVNVTSTAPDKGSSGLIDTVFSEPDTTLSKEEKEHLEQELQEREKDLQKAIEDLEAAREAKMKAMEEYYRAQHDQQYRQMQQYEKQIQSAYKNVKVIREDDSLMVIVNPGDSGSVSYEYRISCDPHKLIVSPLQDDSLLEYLYTPGLPCPEFVPGIDSLMIWHGLKDSDFDFDYDFDYDYNFDFDSDAIRRETDRIREEAERLGRDYRHGANVYRYCYPGNRGIGNNDYHVFESPLPDHRTERIFRQELRDDGLVRPGKDYVVELSADGLFINGDKQSREVYKKYKKLYEALEGTEIDSNHSFKLVF